MLSGSVHCNFSIVLFSRSYGRLPSGMTSVMCLRDQIGALSLPLTRGTSVLKTVVLRTLSEVNSPGVLDHDALQVQQ